MHVFTSIASNYIPKARVLAGSLKKFHPTAKFHLFLSDAVPQSLRKEHQPFDSVLTVEELPIADRKPWIFKHTVIELCTGVKGFAFQYIIDQYKADKIFYFDPDIVIFQPLNELLKRLDVHSILLTPHQTEPDTAIGAIVDNEICCLRHGVYNLGFLAIRVSEESRRFVDWWAERLKLFCYEDVPGGLFTDQRWMDLAPVFFKDIEIVRDPVCNVATWNLTHRRATGSLRKGININGKPLCFYHFSGFDSGAQEIMLNKYGRKSPVLKDLRKWYIRECDKMGQKEFGKMDCVYNYFENGKKILKKHRLLYRARPDLQAAFKDPFSTADTSRSYYHWYNADAQGAEHNPDIYDSDSVEGLRGQVYEMRRELESIKNTYSWRFARTMARLAATCRIYIGKAS